MKKLIMLIALVAAVAVQAETITGKVFSEKTAKGIDYWKIGKETRDGKMSAKANINKDDYERIAPLNGKMIEVTGELDPASKFPSFLAGVQIKEIETSPVQ